jgi:UDP-N-acetylglucosamine--dolichyl-phosphate N-acetylglucosaminephosphotransferase
MGAVCAVVYLMSLIMFIPFAFYKDIVAATSGGGNRDVVIESQHIENGRFLHRFPHGKVRIGLKVFLVYHFTDLRLR